MISVWNPKWRYNPKTESRRETLAEDFLYEAIFTPEGVLAPLRDIVERPELRIYYDDFGTGPTDHCFVAETDGRVVML